MKDFTIVRKGFDTTEVDTYIVDLENEMKKKDKLIEEYRGRENAINRAIIEAQQTADSIVQKAHEDASHIRADVTAELVGLRKEALELRSNLISFQESYNRLLRRYLYTGHCEDMTQIFDRLEAVLKEAGVEEGELSPLPPVQNAPQEDASTRHLNDVLAVTSHLDAESETDAHIDLNEITKALTN